MISDSDLVQYTCIAHHQHHPDSPNSTILAEFNSADSSLKELAQQCLHHTPPHHNIYSQTSKNQAFTFLLDDPFVYFGIFDHNMVKSDQIEFLGKLKDNISNHVNANQKFTSYCLQGELHPVFHKLMSKNVDFDASQQLVNGVHHSNKNNNVGVPVSGSSKGRKIMSLPMTVSSKIVKGLKKKKGGDNVEDVSFGEAKGRGIVCQDGVCMLTDGVVGDGGGGGRGHVGRQKAKKIWRKHVWIVLVLDLAVCLILFGIWLFVCRGFQCIEG